MLRAQRLQFGPYETPQFEIGQKVQCAIRGTVTIAGISKGRIPWPYFPLGAAAAVCPPIGSAVNWYVDFWQ